VLSLEQSQAVGKLANYVSDFLPGKPHPYASQAISFQGIASDLGLLAYWPGGSKLPSVTDLLSGTLEHRPERFPNLLVEIVRRGIRYRASKGNPITREQIERLNEILQAVGFKISELWDREFLKSLPGQAIQKVTQVDSEVMKSFRSRLQDLAPLDPQRRGYEFQAFLEELLDYAGLAPRRPFLTVGEQIDGSFQFQGETYLLEATWRNRPVGAEELNAFLVKVISKAEWSRGVHVAYSGYSQDGLEAFARGKPTKLVCISGLDIDEMLAREIPLQDVIEKKVRAAAETNEAFVSVRDLFP
jgi:hypothetical protein